MAFENIFEGKKVETHELWDLLKEAEEKKDHKRVEEIIIEMKRRANEAINN